MFIKSKNKPSRSIAFVIFKTWILPGMKCTKREIEQSFVNDRNEKKTIDFYALLLVLVNQLRIYMIDDLKERNDHKKNKEKNINNKTTTITSCHLLYFDRSLSSRLPFFPAFIFFRFLSTCYRWQQYVAQCQVEKNVFLLLLLLLLVLLLNFIESLGGGIFSQFSIFSLRVYN